MKRLNRFLGWNYAKTDMDIYISDNASPPNKLFNLPQFGTVLRYQEHLERAPGENGYIYCWRHLYTIKILIQLGYQKIVFLDSDCFLLNGRICNYLESINSGWESFWIEKYKFPAAEFHVLCKDAFPIFEAFTSVPYERHLGKLMETALPFTRINKDFRVDRWGEDRIPQEPWMDVYCQAPVDLDLEFKR